MADDPHHEHLVKELMEQLEPLFSQSPQAIYLYLDDEHKACNKRFADMLGYASPKEWAANEYPVEDLLEEDREKGIRAFMDASEHLTASTIQGTWITKNGTQIQTEVTMIPLPYKNEVFVLHFITPEN